ncbi:hypothetical protein CEXT_335281 [Caerostris extrusa]|uniref:Uncharacterized protein n=1 Tax=Caerostris extrusa TaxID=172846 RepID=A0AAV4T3T6_CAEEX|nr:hypothetical protein CEXT_335281 [Caerostris extrusa]
MVYCKKLRPLLRLKPSKLEGHAANFPNNHRSFRIVGTQYDSSIAPVEQTVPCAASVPSGANSTLCSKCTPLSKPCAAIVPSWQCLLKNSTLCSKCTLWCKQLYPLSKQYPATIVPSEQLLELLLSSVEYLQATRAPE